MKSSRSGQWSFLHRPAGEGRGLLRGWCGDADETARGVGVDGGLRGDSCRRRGRGHARPRAGGALSSLSLLWLCCVVFPWVLLPAVCVFFFSSLPATAPGGVFFFCFCG